MRPLTRMVLFLLVVVALTMFAPTAPAQAATTASSPRITYVALGDSLGFGLWDFSRGGYVYRYAAMLAADTGATVSLINLSVPGWTSSDLLKALRTSWTFRLSVASAQVVTWDIGGNDLLRARDRYIAGTCGGTACLEEAVATFETNWKAIVWEIVRLRGGRPTVYRTMDLYYPFVAQDAASERLPVLLPYLREANAIINSTGCGVETAQVYQAFNGSYTDPLQPSQYLSFDGYHPNSAGHAVIARQLRTLGYEPAVATPVMCP
ncbi:MAG: GDSL-type esterase/lipase family protein [Roseiflexus sp.]|nr:GDSL-type esterase/lipase family protein [Roseiflexus sp.]MCS7287769.1 GDSL-type esterase/lipase family protein [Roseiflexus sp.]MDW8147585.1 GDSL-type esterase/lipase family protein [Roseiflexaceae bacterium]